MSKPSDSALEYTWWDFALFSFFFVSFLDSSRKELSFRIGPVTNSICATHPYKNTDMWKHKEGLKEIGTVCSAILL